MSKTKKESKKAAFRKGLITGGLSGMILKTI